MRRPFALGAVLGAAALIVAIGLVRIGVLRRPTPDNDPRGFEAQAIDTGQRAFRALSMRDLSSAADPDAVRACLSAAAIAEPVGADALRLRSSADVLLQETAELLHHRFVQPAAEEYISWRKRRGYVMESGERMAQLMVAQDYPVLFGEPYPGHEHVERVFERFFDATLDLRDAAGKVTEREAGRIQAVCDEAKGVVVGFGEMGEATAGAWPRLGTGLTPAEWHGMSGCAFRNWWTDPAGGWLACLKRHGRIRVAVVGVVVRLRGGNSYPLMVNYYEDPATRRWWLAALGVGNVRLSVIPGVEW